MIWDPGFPVHGKDYIMLFLKMLFRVFAIVIFLYVQCRMSRYVFYSRIDGAVELILVAWTAQAFFCRFQSNSFRAATYSRVEHVTFKTIRLITVGIMQQPFDGPLISHSWRSQDT